jgi:hypothetical protein
MTWQRRQPGVVRLANLVLLGALFLVPAVAQPAPRRTPSTRG